MNAQTITYLSSILAILGVLAKIVYDYAQVKNKLEQNVERDKEFRQSTEKKFEELYNSRNQTNENLVRLSTILENLVDQTKTIDAKLDELKKGLEK